MVLPAAVLSAPSFTRCVCHSGESPPDRATRKPTLYQLIPGGRAMFSQGVALVFALMLTRWIKFSNRCVSAFALRVP